MRPTAQQRFKEEYPRNLRWSLAIAVPIGLLLATLLPTPESSLPIAPREVFELVESVAVVESTAVRRWRFTPARKDGHAVRSSIAFSIIFDLVAGADPAP